MPIPVYRASAQFVQSFTGPKPVTSSSTVSLILSNLARPATCPRWFRLCARICHSGENGASHPNAHFPRVKRKLEFQRPAPILQFQ